VWVTHFYAIPLYNITHGKNIPVLKFVSNNIGKLSYNMPDTGQRGMKVKVKLSLCFFFKAKQHAMTSALDGGKWSASCPGHFTPKEGAAGTHWIGGWVGPRAILDGEIKKKRETNTVLAKVKSNDTGTPLDANPKKTITTLRSSMQHA
jgi:hypothetical protein